MGLAERRAIKAFQDTKLPALKDAIDQAAGFAVELEVAWDTLAVDDYDHLYDEALPKVYFKPLTEAFKAITVDDMGREALREGLKKAIFRNTGNSEISFESGIVTIDHSPVSNLDYWEDRKKSLQQALEKGL
jgi:hypothetical protein